jgi:hypothetical protein
MELTGRFVYKNRRCGSMNLLPKIDIGVVAMEGTGTPGFSER